MNVIETFGAKVGQLAQTDPEKARRLLLLGFRANGQKVRLFPGTRPRSGQLLFQQVNQSIIRCLARPEQNVMVSLFTPCEMLLNQGLNPYSCEAFSSYLSGSMAEAPFLRRAEEEGIPTSLCSYHKVFIGAAQSGLMPRPRFILSTSLACDANALTFRYLSQLYDVPHFSLDVPYEQTEQAVDYVAGQLRRMGEWIQVQTGIPVDEAKLVQTVARSQRTMARYQQVLTNRAGKQILGDLTDELLRTASLHFLLGSAESEAMVDQLYREVCSAPPLLP